MEVLRELGLPMTVRHRMRDLVETPVEQLPPAEAHLAHTLAIGGTTPGGGHSIAQLDVARANTGSARDCVDLLQALWTPSAIDPQVAERVRDLLRGNLLRYRLAPDFTSDLSTWASKMGTLLNLRHEMGVVEHADGQLFAVAALTASPVPAVNQPDAEALMGHVAQALRDRLREGRTTT